MPRKKKARSDFTPTTRREIAFEAHLFCSNPTCCRFTSYGTPSGRVRAIAEAAHIDAASAGGPRTSGLMAVEDLKSKENGIWLCKNCHSEIDDDPDAYPAALLRDWKSEHRDFVKKLVGKDFDLVHFEAYARSRNVARRHSFLGYISGRRVFFERLSLEFPDQVATSLIEVRSRISEAVSYMPDSDLAKEPLYEMRRLINGFLSANPDLATVRCDGNDPRFLEFCCELDALREKTLPLVVKVAKDTGFDLGPELLEAYRDIESRKLESVVT